MEVGKEEEEVGTEEGKMVFEREFSEKAWHSRRERATGWLQWWPPSEIESTLGLTFCQTDFAAREIGGCWFLAVEG